MTIVSQNNRETQQQPVVFKSSRQTQLDGWLVNNPQAVFSSMGMTAPAVKSVSCGNYDFIKTDSFSETVTSVKSIQVAIDAEWDDNTFSSWMARDAHKEVIKAWDEAGVSTKLGICVQFSVKDGSRGIAFNSNVLDPLSYEEAKALYDKIESIAAAKGIVTFWRAFNDDICLLDEFLRLVGLDAKHVVLRMFYSSRDVWMALGWNNVKRLFELGTSENANIRNSGISQKKCIRGKVKVVAEPKEYEITFSDLKGLSPKGGLKGMADSVGYQMNDKGVMDEYKSCMWHGLLENTESFVNYSIGDVDDLHIIFERFRDYVIHEVCGKVIDVEFSESELPQTTGKLVAKVFEKWVVKKMGGEFAEYAFRKLGILNEDHPRHQTSVKELKALRRSIKTIEDQQKHSERIRDFIEKASFKEVAYSQASVRTMAELKSTAKFAAIVQGGRCVNENPWGYYIPHGLDADLDGCYATALAAFTFPIGLPTVVGYSENDPLGNLGAWTERFRSEKSAENNGSKSKFAPNLSMVVVSTVNKVKGGSAVHDGLSFDQDLIYSRLTTSEQISQAIGGGFKTQDDGGDMHSDHTPAHIAGDFVLLTKEIKNGILTDDMFEILEAVANNPEKGQLKNKLHVVCYAGYLNKHQVKTPEEWVSAVLADNGDRTSGEGAQGQISDDRTCAWYGLPLAEFINPMRAARKKAKSDAKDMSLSPEERAHASGLDAMLKLFINTLYGVLASPYFSIGNTIVANNITARARANAWMMSKGLHTVQTITDGGLYNPSMVPFLHEGEKPGLAVLADRREWLKVKKTNRKIGSLGGLNWDELIRPGMTAEETTELGKMADKLAMEHLKDFWSRYGLEMKIPVEHKGRNTFIAGAYWSKAHYGLKLACPTDEGDETLYRIRGSRDFDEEDLIRNPIHDLLDAILVGKDIPEINESLIYHHTRLETVTSWGIKVKRARKEGINDDDIRPGYDCVEERLLRLDNLHFPIESESDYRTAVKRKNGSAKKNKDGTYREFKLFERYLDEGISYMHRRMVNGTLY